MSPCNCGGSQQAAPTAEPVATATEQPASTRNLRQSFRLDMPSGESFIFGSRLEADAARIRAGGTGTVRKR